MLSENFLKKAVLFEKPHSYRTVSIGLLVFVSISFALLILHSLMYDIGERPVYALNILEKCSVVYPQLAAISFIDNRFAQLRSI